jgi:O-antigen/teichoic acid export membrane protein
MYSLASMLSAVLAFGMETTFFRYSNKTDIDKDKVYNNSFIVIASTSVVLLTVALLFSRNFAQWMSGGGQTTIDDYASYIRYFIFILIIDGISIIPFARIRAEGKPLRYGMIKLINVLTFVGLNLFFILLIPGIIKGGGPLASYFSGWYKMEWIGYVFISNLIASAVTLLLLIPELLKLKLRADWSLIRDMFAYSFPVLIANISFIINENVDKIFLKALLPPIEGILQVGIYGACAKIAIFLSIFIQAFRLGAEPFFFSHEKNKNSGDNYATIMNYFVIAISIIFVALVANIEVLKIWIRSEDPEQRDIYWAGLKVVPILLFGYVSLGIYMNLSIWYKLSDQTRFGLYISGVGALLTIVMNLLFIPKYGYIASAWISLAAYTSMMVLSYILGQKNYPIPYNLKKNLSYIAVSILLVVLSFNVFDRNLLIGNALLFVFLLGTFLIERKALFAILHGNSHNK